ncbi:hypothetical protein I4U23_005150 [Adineta vaga]|nr:hypothetical protein I4U23_005150 [Adineta vaga]
MARANTTTCFTCSRSNGTYLCVNCSQYFCFEHLNEHRQLLENQLISIEDQRNNFLQTVNEQKSNRLKHSIIKQIDRCEYDSINKIRQAAEESRQLLVPLVQKHIPKVEVKLKVLTERLKQTRQEKDINETNLIEYKEKLDQLIEELDKIRNVLIKEDTTPFIAKLSVVILSRK